jgi:putative ABC transport system permease protein
MAAPLFVIAVRNVRKSWRTSLASVLSIFAGFAAAVLFQGFVTDAAEAVGGNYQRIAMLGDVLVGPSDSSMEALEDLGRARLRPEEQAFLETFLEEQRERVQTRVRFLYLSGQVAVGGDASVFAGYGYDVAEGAVLRTPPWAWNTLGGVPLQEAASPEGILLGRRLAVLARCTFGGQGEPYLPEGGFRPERRPLSCPDPTVELRGTAEDGSATQRSAEVVGVVDAGLRQLESRFLVMPLALAQDLLHTQDVSLYSIALKAPAHAAAFSQALQAKAAEAGMKLQAMPWREHGFFGDLYRRTVEVLRIYSNFLFGVVVFIGVMSVTNTVTRAVMERTREIGTLRSLGFQPRHIVTLFAWEGLLLGVFSCAAGAVVAAAIAIAVSHLGMHYPEGIASFPIRIRIRIVPEVYAEVALVLSLLSSAAAVIPAWHATRMRVATALLSE